MNEKFCIIFDAYKEDIFRLIYSYTLDINDSKDILQDTFLKFYKHISSFPEDETFIKKWLIRVAINQAKDYNKCFWKRKNINYEDNTKFNDVDNLKTNIEILEVLNTLDKKYRIPIYMYYYEGYHINEIASLLGTSPSAIKMRLKKAKELLKREMERV